jgi:hypothetical protein
MARPRIFISSTFYDLKQVRSELERFVKEQGYEPILNERGHIAYGKDSPLEDYCYREIEGVDVLVSIIGSRFGAESHHKDDKDKGKSISQVELEAAIKHHKQVYIFIERNVYAEYDTYTVNKDSKDVKFKHTDRRVYEYLEQILALPLNNAAAPFELATDITSYLREQWAGLFQRLLQDSEKTVQGASIQELNYSLKTVRDLVTYLTEERKGQDSAIGEILKYNHPIFEQLRTLLGVTYRVFFVNHTEMTQWLNVRSYSLISKELWDDNSIEEWSRTVPNDMKPTHFMLLKINRERVFDEEGSLRLYTAVDWNKSWVEQSQVNLAPKDDDIPF